MKFNFSNSYSTLLLPDAHIVTGVFKGLVLSPSAIKIDEISQGYLSTLLHRGILNDELGKVVCIYDIPNLVNKQVLLVGCGEKTEFNANNYRKLLKKVISLCKKIPINIILFYLSELDINQYNEYWKIRQTIEIINEQLYVFNQFKNKKIPSYHEFNQIILHITKENELNNCKKAITDGLSIANGIKIAKNLGNLPPNFCTPNYLVNQVQEVFNHYPNVKIDIIDALLMQKLGMNAYLSVGRGSSYAPIMPIINYIGHPDGIDIPPIVLIGKGLTFDTGGLSIKNADKMDEMKYDMCGAAVVFAVMQIAIELCLPLNIVGILAICENMISSTSLRPGDILKTLSGQTVEVLNTDAEGRLVLCDVLTYVERYNPKIVIDIATLTGACVIALGHHFSGLMSNSENLANDLLIASKQSRDYVWRLPLDNVFEKQLKSSCADMTNVGGKSGSVITAGCFLQKFAYKYNWAHLDIAGTAWKSNYRDKSATGRPVALLSQFLLNSK